MGTRIRFTLKESAKNQDNTYNIFEKDGLNLKRLTVITKEVSTDLPLGSTIEERFQMHEIESYRIDPIQEGIRVKFKKIDKNATTPSYAKLGDAGLDMTATSVTRTQKYIEYGTGIVIEIPIGFVGLLFPRSSVTNKTLMLKNCVGIIDSIYRGEVKLRFLNTSKKVSEIEEYAIGDKCGQLIILPYPQIRMIESEELSDTERGDFGFGSTGN